VVLLARDLDVDLGRGVRLGHVLDPGQLVEDEGGDRGEDQDGPGRPHQLRARVAVDLEAVDLAAASAAPVPNDEEDERPLDEKEDERREAEDEVVRVVDPGRVRRVGRRRRETPVRGGCGSCGDERESAGGEEQEELPAHGRWHPTALWRAVPASSYRPA